MDAEKIVDRIIKDRTDYETKMILEGKGLDIKECPHCGMRKCMCSQDDVLDRFR